MWLPKRNIVIDRFRILNVEKVKGFLGKYRLGQPLIKIKFLDDNHQEDECAWLVSNPD